MHGGTGAPQWTRRSFLALVALVAARRAVAAEGSAPSPIKLIVPAAPGGSLDRLGRIVADALSRILETPVDVQNMPGDGGVTGMNAVAATAPGDGTVLGLANSTAIIGGKLLSRSARFKPIEDFDWLTILGTYPNAMVVAQRSPARDITEWLELARKAPTPLVYASAGTGSAGHLAGAYLRVEKGARLTHTVVDNLDDGYKLLGEGFIDVLFDGAPNAMTEVRPRDHRILAVTSEKRVQGLPGVPSFGELWQRSFDIFVGIVAPKALAQNAYARLAPAVGVLLSEPAHANSLRAAGLNFLGLSGRGTRAYIENEFLRNAQLIAALNNEGVRK
ncbi:MAG: tripartite tricarboxylate transporter substrate binding protein [Casimicrobiaceae bacterium]